MSEALPERPAHPEQQQGQSSWTAPGPPENDLWRDHPSSGFDAPAPEAPPTPEPTEFNDEHLKQAMVRAMWIVVVLTSVLFSVLLLIWGWQTALLLVVGAAISLASLWEWRKLLALIMARLDNQKAVGQGG